MTASVATAKRPPTFKEREGVTAALPASFRSEPVGCVWLDVSVANSGRYAIVGPEYLNALRLPCLKYAANGFWILKKAARWKVIWVGSDLPRCSLRVPRDLVGCLP